MTKKVIVAGAVVAFLFSVFLWTRYINAEDIPLLPKEARAVFDKYAQRYPQGRLDHASKIGNRFFLGIIVFPKGDELDARYLLVGRFREWEPIAEFEKLPY